MDGFSDSPYRALCRSFGSRLSYIPFVSALELIQGSSRARSAAAFYDAERPVIVQLFDDDEARLLQAARMLLPFHPDGIDVNMGCSSRRVSGRGAGAGLLRDPVKIGRILRLLSSALPIPVTAKIRIGWDHESRNHIEVAQTIEANGGQAIAVHGRTRAQGYEGCADWDAIAEIVQSVEIPIIGNGDVNSPEDAMALLKHTGCDAVMIGRAAIGNPWIFQRRERGQVSPLEWSNTVRDHLARMVRYYGERIGVRRFRKHLARYMDRYRLAERDRRFLLTRSSAHELFHWLDELCPCRAEFTSRAWSPRIGDDSPAPSDPVRVQQARRYNGLPRVERR
jgi:nifR3 family TIM-barrel protein